MLLSAVVYYILLSKSLCASITLKHFFKKTLVLNNFTVFHNGKEIKSTCFSKFQKSRVWKSSQKSPLKKKRKRNSHWKKSLERPKKGRLKGFRILSWLTQSTYSWGTTSSYPKNSFNGFSFNEHLSPSKLFIEVWALLIFCTSTWLHQNTLVWIELAI